MILPLRRRHRRMFAILGLLLPLAFIAGVAARKPIPTAPLFTDSLSPRKAFTKAKWDRSDLFPKTALRVQLLCQEGTVSRCAIQFSAAKDFVKADLLVYWLPAASKTTDMIPEDAILLGVFSSFSPLPLSDGSVGKPGVLVLYSLADHEIIDVSKLVTF
jgi:hypothetical protein